MCQIFRQVLSLGFYGSQISIFVFNVKTPMPIHTSFSWNETGHRRFLFGQIFQCDCFKTIRLVGKSLSTLCAASLQNVSSVRSLHSLSEAVLLFSLTLFRLVSSEHLLHLLNVLIGSVCTVRLMNRIAFFSYFYAFTQWHPILYTIQIGFVKSFSKFFFFFCKSI